jgi:hypothetical protein
MCSLNYCCGLLLGVPTTTPTYELARRKSDPTIPLLKTFSVLCLYLIPNNYKKIF